MKQLKREKIEKIIEIADTISSFEKGYIVGENVRSDEILKLIKRYGNDTKKNLENLKGKNIELLFGYTHTYYPHNSMYRKSIERIGRIKGKIESVGKVYITINNKRIPRERIYCIIN